MATAGTLRVEVKAGTAAQVVIAAREARAALLEASRLASPMKRDVATRRALGVLDRALAKWEARGKTLQALEPMTLEDKAEAFRDAAKLLEAVERLEDLRQVRGAAPRAREHAKRFRLWAEVLEHDATDPRVPRIGWRALRSSLGSLVGIGFALVGLAAAAFLLRLLWGAVSFGWGLLG